MAFDTRFLNINPANGDLVQRSGVTTSAGASAGDIVALNGSAQIDSSLLPAIASSFTPATETSSFSALIDYFYSVDLVTAAADVVATLPDATTCSGKLLIVQVQTSSSPYTLALDTVSSQTVNGAAVAGMPTLSNVDQTFLLISDGSNWWTVSPVTDLAHNVTGTLAVPHGGTGQVSLPAYSVLLGNGTGAVADAAPSTAGIALVSTGASSNPSFSALGLAVSGAISGVLPVLHGPGVITATAGATNIPANAMIYIDSTGKIQLADNTTPVKATGFAPVAILATVSGQVVIGNGPNAGLSGLTVGSDYFLDAAGAVVATVPSTPGTILQKVGFAESATVLQVLLGAPVLLS